MRSRRLATSFSRRVKRSFKAGQAFVSGALAVQDEAS